MECEKWIEEYLVNMMGISKWSAHADSKRISISSPQMFDMTKEEWVRMIGHPGRSVYSHLAAVKIDGYLGGGNVPVGLYTHSIYAI